MDSVINIKKVPQNHVIWLYSNPLQVQRNALKHGIYRDIYLSDNPMKKYMLLDDNNKILHFGAMGYSDFTKHKDISRRKNFNKRNNTWNSYPKYTPAYLSYNLLW